MSEGDVSLIRDEDVLRRMWQQTEDFSRKKEIRAHMYRLREERLRNLYSPEPGAEGKGCEFTSTQGHVKSFADQSFQSMKSKEVRDAGSPPKEFSYRGQDLKELSNAGWNVESENRTTDDGHTHIKSVQANIEGRYDVEGGKGQFAAIDQHKQAVTEYDDGNTSLKRNESTSNTAAHEQVVRKTDDGTQFSSTTSSSTSTSKFQKISSTNETVPYVTNKDYDLSRQVSHDTNRNEEVTTRRTTQTNDYEQNLRSDYEHGEVVSRKVEYPDDNTKVVVETRRLPDGTKVTSTRREFRAPVVQSSRSEQHSQQTKSESKTSSYTSTQKQSHINESSSKITREMIDTNTNNIVDTQRAVDDFDFKKRRNVDNVVNTNDDYTQTTQYNNNNQKYENYINDVNHREIISSHDNQNIHRNDRKETQIIRDSEDRVHNITRETKREEVIERKISSDQYQTTYQADFSQKKISNDWSPSQQAWASSLRSDTPTRPSTRASSPGSKTFRSSNSSLRSSVSPDKTYRKPHSRGESPTKIDRYSPTRTISDRYSSTHSTHSVTEIKSNTYTSPERRPLHPTSPTRPSYSPERKHDKENRARPSISPEKRLQSPSDKSRKSPDRKPQRFDAPEHQTYTNKTPIRPRDSQGNRLTPTRSSPSPDRNITTEKSHPNEYYTRRTPDRSSPDKKIPGVFHDRVSPTRSKKSPDRKPSHHYPENNSSDNAPKYPRDPSPPKSAKPKDKKGIEDQHLPEKTSNTSDKKTDQDKTPGYMRPTAASTPKVPNDPISPAKGGKPDDKSPTKNKTFDTPLEPNITKVREDHYKFIDEETKMYTRTNEQILKTAHETSTTSKNLKRLIDSTTDIEPNSNFSIPKTCPSLVKQSPSPDSPVASEQEYTGGPDRPDMPVSVVNPSLRHKSPSPDKYRAPKTVSPTRKSPAKDVPTKTAPSADKHTPSRGSSPTKKDSPDSPYFNRHDSRSTSPRSTLRKDSPSPDKLKSSKHISEIVTTSSVRSESSNTSLRKNSPSPDKYPMRPSSPAKKLPSADIPESTRNKSPTNISRPMKSNSPDKFPSRETSPGKKPRVQDDLTTEIPDDNSKLRKDSSNDTKRVIKELSPNIKDSNKCPENIQRQTTPRKSPSKDTPDFTTSEPTNTSHPILRNTSRSPSPNKTKLKDIRSDTYEINESSDTRTNKTSTTKILIENVTKEHYDTIVTDTSKDTPSRESSPSKFGTYKKTQRLSKENKETTDIVPVNEPNSPKKPTVSTVLPTKVTTQDVTSIRDVKHQQTNDFLNVERKVEENNKNTTTKQRPKQLVTPSTSPTRKPKGVETEPSTGQSSPTTSVSGFVYFSSPCLEKPTVTDLDEQELDSENSVEDVKTNQDDEFLKSSRSKSPSKIPCRSPSPEKRPTKDNLPRKSSLKKPSVDNNQVSPTEKPPSSFSVSPMVESKDFLEKQPENKTEVTPKSSPKPKPPLERRETYEERCRKILGMSDDTTIETTTTTTDEKTLLKNTDSNASSPSVSPCRSPGPYEETLRKESKTNFSSTDFLKQERKDIIESNVHHDRQSKDFKMKKPETSSRGASPTKPILKHTIDITSEETSTVITDKNQAVETKKQTITKIDSKQPSRQSPERKLKDQPSTKRPYSMPNPLQNTEDEGHPKENIPGEQQILDKLKFTQDTSLTQTQKSPTTSKTSPKDQNTEPISKSPTSGFKNEPVKPKDSSPTRSQINSSPVKRTPNSKTNVAVTSMECNITQTTESIQEDTVTDVIEDEFITPRSSISPNRKIPKDSEHTTISREDYKNVKESSIIQTKDYSTQFIHSEREQEVLDKVHKSLRKLSPERNGRSPSRETSPLKTSKKPTSTQDVDRNSQIPQYSANVQKTVNESLIETNRKSVVSKDDTHMDKTKFDKPKEPKVSSKPPSRNVSPIKKTTNTYTKPDSPESPSKTRSISPKKLATSVDRPQSPQIQKYGGTKTRDSIPSHIRKPSPSSTSPTRNDKTIEKIATDSKKTISAIKQNSFSKIATTKMSPKSLSNVVYKPTEADAKQTTPKGINKENMNPKKDSDTKVIRTTSDITLKTKKIPSQRIKSRPEIQVSDMSTARVVKQTPTTKGPKSQPKESPTKFPTSKPKSATALNTSIEDDDIIIDVQQAKSSRENSPDRICPTPVGFLEDVGTPRFPDEVNEPDDEFNKRTYHTIHESESIVDDIVEICEDDELFVKQTDVNHAENYLLNINDKVSKFSNKTGSTNITKDSARFKDVEKQVHSDFDSENIKSDECLLSVSEKVNKFAKGPRGTKDNRSPSRNIVDEYDKNTIYQDDYTKLSVNDKAHLFVETAENVKVSKPKPAQKIERPDFSDIDDSLRSDDCLLSVSDKVNKFVKTAEQFLNETHEVEEKEKRIKEEHDKIMKKIVDDTDDENTITKITENINVKSNKYSEHDEHQRQNSFVKETTASQAKTKDYANPNTKPTDRNPPVKITTMRSSEAVKKAKALFENIASTTQKTKDVTNKTKATKLTDIGVIKKSPKTDSTNALHPSLEDGSVNLSNLDSDKDEYLPVTVLKDHSTHSTVNLIQQTVRDKDEKIRSSPSRFRPHSPEISRTKSPLGQVTETTTTTTTKTVLSRYPATERAASPKQARPDPEKPDKPHDKIPGYLRPTKTSQIKEESKATEITDTEVSSRRGSGKFGVELRRTSVERSTVSSERRRSSVEHHQPCIEDIFELDLLEQMLEKVVGYEQRRRIRAQIRVAKKRLETEQIDSSAFSRTTKVTTTRITKARSPDRPPTKSPERHAKPSPHKTFSPDRQPKSTPQKIIVTDHLSKPSPDRSEIKEPSKPMLNGHGKEPTKTINDKRQRPHSPEKPVLRSIPKSPVRPHSPEKKTRPLSPTKTTTSKSKGNRFNEYASAYMKKVGLNESDKLRFSDLKTKKIVDDKNRRVTEHRAVESRQTTTVSKSVSERTSSKDTIEIIHLNGKRSPSPEKKRSPERMTQSPERTIHRLERKPQSPERKPQSPERKPQSPERKPQSPERKPQSPERKPQSPERKPQSPERKHQSPERTARPEFKRHKSDTASKKEVLVKSVFDIEKKIPQKQQQEEKPSWVTNRNLKKITSETRTFSTKKIESDKPKYRATSPSKIITKPIDVITSSYGPGPLDADGRPLFGIKALRNGATNYQVKGTVIRQEFHSRNGSEPEGTVSVTAYSTEPEDLEKLLQSQGDRPSRLHGLAAITTTKKFGGDTGTTLSEVHNKNERAALDQFTHSDRRIIESRIESGTESLDRREQRRLQSERVEVVDVSDIDRTEEKQSQRERLERSETETVSTQNDRRQKDRVEKKSTATTERRDDRRGKDRMERSERSERREDRKTVRQSSVKSLTEKFIKSASETSKSERSAYPKAGLILRTATMKDSVSSDSSAHAGLTRTDSEHSLGSVEDSVVTTTTSEQLGDGVRTTTTTTRTHTHAHAPQTKRTQERSFLDSTTKVTGVQDILTRMKNADIVIEEGDSSADTEARALLNKFLGATVLMAGMQGYVTERPSGKLLIEQETVQSSGGKVTSSRRVEELDIEQCWDERVLRKLLDECTDYEQRRRLRARIRTLMAEQEACASAVTDALAAAGEGGEADDAAAGEREEEEVTTVTSSVRRNSSEKTVSSSTTTIKNSKVIESMTRPAPKPVSPFAKFRQLEKQNSTNTPRM